MTFQVTGGDRVSQRSAGQDCPGENLAAPGCRHCGRRWVRCACGRCTRRPLPGPVLAVNGPQAPEEFVPKQLTYELDGTLGDGGMLSYIDIDGHPHTVNLTSLPWSHTETTTLTVVSGSISAQVHGGEVHCRMLVEWRCPRRTIGDTSGRGRHLQGEIRVSAHQAEPAVLRKNGPSPRHPDHRLLGPGRRHDEHLHSEGRGRRSRTRGSDDSDLRAVPGRDAAHRREVSGVHVHQPDDGRAGGRPPVGRQGPPVLRRPDAAAEGRHPARAVRDGSMGQADHRRRRTERRWQVHVRAAASGRRHRADPGQPIRRMPSATSSPRTLHRRA